MVRPPSLVAAVAVVAVVVPLAGCAAAPVVVGRSVQGAPTCGLEGCGKGAWADLPSTAAGSCARSTGSQTGECGGLSPSACTDEALARWGSPRAERTLACVAGMLSEACGQGEARACGFAGRLWLDGKGLEKNVDRGMKMLVQACDGGVPLACLVGSRFLGDASSAGTAPDGPDGQHRLEMQYSCLSGQGDACMQVGASFRIGDEGFPRDFAQAVVAYGRGCNLGDARSCNNLGDALAYGEGVDRDLYRAVDAFDKSCRLGEALGCANLGYRLERGLGVARDLARARSLYRDACNIGSAYACLHLELLAAQGGKPARDPAGSLARWARACDGRDGRACAFVGLLYDDGPDGLARDETRSLAAMARGCTLGEPRACDWVRLHTDD
jgi:TPR repeat protein